MKLGFLFAGQGSQFKNMGQDLYKDQPLYKQTIDQASKILGMDMSDPKVFDDINNAQVAILTMSYAIYRILRTKLPEPAAMVGLSLGEYSALISAGSLSFEDGLKLVHDRSHYMDEAGAKHPGAMAAVLKTDPSKVKAICDTVDGAYPCNYNTATQTVIGGTKEGIKAARKALKAHGIRIVIPLKVAVASHTPLMQLASDLLAKRMAKMTFAAPKTTVMSNTLAKPFTQQNIKPTLIKQLVNPTHFAQDVAALKPMHLDGLVEVGPGHTLSHLAHKTLPDVKNYRVDSVKTLHDTLDQLGVK
ncbi:ACP S-malonyltransferase [Acetilactobacillus jinshanensis]|uniref:Malonyl CoA-acyl carrier protein transacylase n=1 Tax=Acetilactobacillus jinshanensis TaxID=1720083 RepID=A0A4P6ZJ06_9LACO|nr:ACP S-malonyltransferase [Acetilactobacillus jinshanensis]QBP17695.1 ACP S-malonyltransferase [Acetilactobacillus jinshanensis]URL61761.1 ACP S-malonyltransferase [uncultured bacterium]